MMYFLRHNSLMPSTPVFDENGCEAALYRNKKRAVEAAVVILVFDQFHQSTTGLVALISEGHSLPLYVVFGLLFNQTNTLQNICDVVYPSLLYLRRRDPMLLFVPTESRSLYETRAFASRAIQPGLAQSQGLAKTLLTFRVWAAVFRSSTPSSDPLIRSMNFLVSNPVHKASSTRVTVILNLSTCMQQQPQDSHRVDL